jgi:hypothetical protein
MSTLKSFMEAHQIVSADFKISPKTGRKVRTQTKNVKDVGDEVKEDTQVVEGLGRGREDDEYHVPDPVRQPQHKIHVEITPKDSTVKQKRTATVSTHHGREHPVKTALAHYKKQGATVHSHQYGGVHEETEVDSLEKAIFETTDQGELRLLQLARLGLVDASDVSKLKSALDALHSDKQLSPAQRTIIIHLFTNLSSLVTGDISIFNRVKTEVQREAKELPPFDPPYKTTPENIKDKSGAVHTPNSRVHNLARLALKKQQDKSKK